MPSGGLVERGLHLGFESEGLGERLARKLAATSRIVSSIVRDEGLCAESGVLTRLRFESEEAKADIRQRAAELARHVRADVVLHEIRETVSQERDDLAAPDELHAEPDYRHGRHHDRDELLDLGSRCLTRPRRDELIDEPCSRPVELACRVVPIKRGFGFGLDLAEHVVGFGFVGRDTASARRASNSVVATSASDGLSSSPSSFLASSEAG